MSEIKSVRFGPKGEDRLLRFFDFGVLPGHLAESHVATVIGVFGHAARQVVATLPASVERTVALRKLLEAKDAAVRAAL